MPDTTAIAAPATAASAKPGQPVVEAVGLCKIFRDFWGRPKARAVNGINFTVRQGQVFGLLGPNGSGKSTTVKMILGLLHPTRGKLEVFGAPPSDVQTKHRIGYLPEETYLYRYLTARETLDFFGALFGLSPSERKNRIEQLLEMVGLANSFNRPVGEFSKGMARRIGLAQALVNDPDLVILDEPTSGLDPIGCREVKDVIRLLAQRGKTVILCSHLLADVQDVCDEVVVLYGGNIRTSGNLGEILTVSDQTRITSPRLDEATLAAVQALIRQRVGEGTIKVDQPTMDLEEFFLDVVRQAREASVETAGVQSGGRIAAYLQGGEKTAEADAGQILAALSGPQNGPAPAPAPEAPKPEPKPAVDLERLQNLNTSAPTPQASQNQASEQEAERQRQTAETNREEANKRLQGLLDNQSGKDK
jgi:ABC-2 type transport system ATP-binding protein